MTLLSATPDPSNATGVEILREEGITHRDEANAFTAWTFRRSFLEDIHSGTTGFSDEEMKKLMIDTSARVATLLQLRDEDPNVYCVHLLKESKSVCLAWDREATEYTMKTTPIRACSHCREAVRDAWSFCASCGHRLGDSAKC